MPLPERRGLYDPGHEHESCGVGFVVDVAGKPSHASSRRNRHPFESRALWRVQMRGIAETVRFGRYSDATNWSSTESGAPKEVCAFGTIA
jgi:glutamate synthase domain-containing protein 1